MNVLKEKHISSFADHKKIVHGHHVCCTENTCAQSKLMTGERDGRKKRVVGGTGTKNVFSLNKHLKKH